LKNFALRDYGTATWEGGDASCDHLGAPKRTQAGFNERYFGKGFAADKQGELRQPQRAVCGTCGARRVDAQIGLEDAPETHVAALVAVFREVRRVLRNDGCLWLNVGDSYGNERSWGGKSGAKNAGSDAGGYPRHKVGPGLGNKQLLMMPSRVAIALQADGWLLRAMIPWLKRSAMPESVTDRPTTATEYVFLLSEASSYFYDADAVRVPGGTTAEQATTKWATRREGRGKGQREGVYHPGAAPFANDPHPAGRNRRNADWWFDSLAAILAGAGGLLTDEDGAPLALPVNPQPFPGSHFAVFPERLVEPMLLASTSARGACGKCGAPWVRTTEASYTPHPAGGHVGFAARGDAGGMKDLSAMPRLTKHVETTGWRAGCGCEDAGEPVPCVCLDPFAGAGTVGVVARKHGRHFIGIDLSEPYLAMARERLGQLALPGLVAD
jgi:DNA modification methylase